MTKGISDPDQISSKPNPDSSADNNGEPRPVCVYYFSITGLLTNL